MTFKAIKLSAAESDWRLFTIRRADPKFQKFQQRVFARDEQTCQYCGFKSTKFMDVVNADGNYRHNHVNNLVTSCPFCTQCFFLDGIGKGDFGGATLIYLPEMSQNDLNALCHVLFAMVISGGRSSGDAKTIYRSLRMRGQYIEKELGKGLTNPSMYGQLLIDAKIKDKDNLHDVLMTKMRVLPTMTRYVSQMEAWGLEALLGMG